MQFKIFLFNGLLNNEYNMCSLVNIRYFNILNHSILRLNKI